MMYAFAKPEAVRSFRESWKRDPDCAICYWGEAWAWGSYLNAPMNGEEAPHAYEAIQKALTLEGQGRPQRARDDRRAGGSLRRRTSTRASASSRTAPTRRRWRSCRRPYPDRPRHRDALRRLAVPARAAARHARHQHARTSSTCTTCSRTSSRRTSIIPARATCTCTPPSRPSCPARPRIARSSSARRFPGASHINHMPSHTWNEVGRWGDSVRAESRGVAFGSEGGDRRRLRDLPGAQPAHAALRGLDGRPGRDRDAGREGLREADRRHVAIRC